MRLLLGCLILLAGPPLFACSCGPIDTTDANFLRHAAHYDVVFIGEVTERDAGTARFRILRHYKGLAESETVVSRHFDSCSTLYDPGIYLIFGTMERGFLNTSYCSLNRQLSVEEIPPEDPYGTLRLQDDWPGFLAEAHGPRTARIDRLLYSGPGFPPWLLLLLLVLVIGSCAVGLSETWLSQ